MSPTGGLALPSLNLRWVARDGCPPCAHHSESSPPRANPVITLAPAVVSWLALTSAGAKLALPFLLGPCLPGCPATAHGGGPLGGPCKALRPPPPVYKHHRRLAHHAPTRPSDPPRGQPRPHPNLTAVPLVSVTLGASSVAPPFPSGSRLRFSQSGRILQECSVPQSRISQRRASSEPQTYPCTPV